MGCESMKQLFESVTLNHVTFNNRIIRSDTWEGIATPDGGTTDIGYDIYEELAKGHIGGIITGFTSVADNDFYMGGMMRLSNDSLISQHKKLVDILHATNTPAFSQLALGAFYKKSASGMYHETDINNMTKAEIHEVVDQFITAAVRAEQAGYDDVQIHIAHFFLLSRFVSPVVKY